MLPHKEGAFIMSFIVANESISDNKTDQKYSHC